MCGGWCSFASCHANIASARIAARSCLQAIHTRHSARVMQLDQRTSAIHLMRCMLVTLSAFGMEHTQQCSVDIRAILAVTARNLHGHAHMRKLVTRHQPIATACFSESMCNIPAISPLLETAEPDARGAGHVHGLSMLSAALGKVLGASCIS